MRDQLAGTQPVKTWLEGRNISDCRNGNGILL